VHASERIIKMGREDEGKEVELNFTHFVDNLILPNYFVCHFNPLNLNYLPRIKNSMFLFFYEISLLQTNCTKYYPEPFTR
jgi:hypothetical protein